MPHQTLGDVCVFLFLFAAGRLRSVRPHRPDFSQFTQPVQVTQHQPNVQIQLLADFFRTGAGFQQRAAGAQKVFQFRLKSGGAPPQHGKAGLRVRQVIGASALRSVELFQQVVPAQRQTVRRHIAFFKLKRAVARDHAFEQQANFVGRVHGAFQHELLHLVAIDVQPQAHGTGAARFDHDGTGTASHDGNDFPHGKLGKIPKNCHETSSPDAIMPQAWHESGNKRSETAATHPERPFGHRLGLRIK